MSQFDQEPGKELLEESYALIRPYVHRTPVLQSRAINEMAETSLFFKCENMQRVGAFKFRGGIHTMLRLSAEERAKGVATHSSGNHAQAVALAAQLLGAKAYIVMPSNAPEVKIKAVKGYGAEVTLCEPTLDARETTLATIIEQTGATMIHPYDDYRVIAGQATAARELLEEHPEIDCIVAPIGGGGLMAGTLLTAKYADHEVRVVGSEPTGADDAYRSWQKGERIPMVNPKTIADGLLTSVGERNFAIIKRDIETIFTVSDEEIIAAMRIIWERLKIVIEPSCAVPFAAILQQKAHFAGRKTGVILTGGNVDLGKLPF